MVAPVERIKVRGPMNKNNFDESFCVSYETALSLGERYDGVGYNYHIYEALGEVGLDLEDVNVRVDKQRVTVDTVGCIPEHASSKVAERTVVVNCPEDKEDRCKGCIIDSLENGERFQEGLAGRSDSVITSHYLS